MVLFWVRTGPFDRQEPIPKKNPDLDATLPVAPGKGNSGTVYPNPV